MSIGFGKGAWEIQIYNMGKELKREKQKQNNLLGHWIDSHHFNIETSVACLFCCYFLLAELMTAKLSSLDGSGSLPLKEVQCVHATCTVRGVGGHLWSIISGITGMSLLIKFAGERNIKLLVCLLVKDFVIHC